MQRRGRVDRATGHPDGAVRADIDALPLPSRGARLGRESRLRFVRQREPVELVQGALQPGPVLGHLQRAAVTAQAGDVEKNVGRPVVRDDEAISLGSVEPLDDARDLDQADGGFLARRYAEREVRRSLRPHVSVVPLVQCRITGVAKRRFLHEA